MEVLSQWQETETGEFEEGNEQYRIVILRVPKKIFVSCWMYLAEFCPRYGHHACVIAILERRLICTPSPCSNTTGCLTRLDELDHLVDLLRRRRQVLIPLISDQYIV